MKTQTKNLSAIVGIAAVVLLIGAGCTTATSQLMNTSSGQVENKQMMKNNDPMMVDDSEMDNDESMMGEKATTMMDAIGSYEIYAPEKLAMANNGSVVLFFHAPWCPSCKTLNDAIMDSQKEIPDGITIFKTDYDTYTDLKKKYGVTYQHTFVQVDANGNEIKQWSGGSTLEDVLENIQS